MSSNLTADLQEHLKLCQEIFNLAQRENHLLRDPRSPSPLELCHARRSLLPRLNTSLEGLRRHRAAWQRLPPDQRAQQPQVVSLLRQNQDLIMKILVLDRENEQGLLRRGLVPPRHLPPASRQRPHFVADLYRRSGIGSANAD
jgi:hypothetical protein